MALVTIAIDAFTARRTPGNLALAGVLCVLYAASDEWHQTFVPQRGGVFSDVLIDCGGIAIAAFALSRRGKRSPPVA